MTEGLYRVTLRTEAGLKVAEAIVLASGPEQAGQMVSLRGAKSETFHDYRATQVERLGEVVLEPYVEHDGIIAWTRR